MERRTGSSSSDSPTPHGEYPGDLPGEALTRQDLAEVGGYQLAPDEHTAEELTDRAEPSDSVLEIDDVDQLDDAEAEARADADGTLPAPAAQLRTARPVRRVNDLAAAEGVPARRDRAGALVEPRTSPAQFVGQSVEELKKVVWPTGNQVRQYFLVVLVFVLFVIAYVVLLDSGFGALLLQFLG